MLNNKYVLDPYQIQNKIQEKMRKNIAKERKQIFDATYSIEQASIASHRTEQEIMQKLQNKELLGIKKGRHYYFPKWQFDKKTQNGFIPGLDLLIQAGSHLATLEILSWFKTPQLGLGKKTPIQALRKGYFQEVVAELKAIGVT